MTGSRVRQVRTLKTKAAPEVDIPHLVSEIVLSMIDFPDEFEMEVIEGEETTKMRVKTAARDRGKVIGKQGQNARAIRTILNAAGMKRRHGYALEVVQEWAERDGQGE